MSPSRCARRTVAELGEGEADAEAGDGLELVQRSAGVAEAAARDHGHVDAAGRGQRSEDQRRLVAHAARGVLVDLGAGQVGEVEHLARAASSPRVRATVSAAVMPLKKTAMARAEAW